MPAGFSEELETGDRVKNDQTVTLRVAFAKKKVRGAHLTQCPGGCGRYLTGEEMSEHHCLGPPRPAEKKRQWHKRALRKAMREADKAGKLAEFIAKL